MVQWPEMKANNRRLLLSWAGIEESPTLFGQCSTVIASAAICTVSQKQMVQIGGKWPNGPTALSRLQVVVPWGNACKWLQYYGCNISCISLEAIVC